MASVKQVSSERSPGECLRAALDAESPAGRIEHAREGLIAISQQSEDELDVDTHFLLLRQVYLSELEAHRFRAAADVALEMAALPSMVDVARHDASRALLALEDRGGAVAQQRLAARAAPPERRSFQWWSLGVLLHFGGDAHGALHAFRRGQRWASDDRPLIRAHAAWVELENGDVPEDLEGTLRDLESSPRARTGYGCLILGMLRYLMGDLRGAAVHLRSWLRRNAAADAAKSITLREELRRARTVLAEIESD